MLYVVSGLAFGFVFERPFDLHVCNSYRNILIILLMSDDGKVSQVMIVLQHSLFGKSGKSCQDKEY